MRQIKDGVEPDREQARREAGNRVQARAGGIGLLAWIVMSSMPLGPSLLMMNAPLPMAPTNGGSELNVTETVPRMALTRAAISARNEKSTAVHRLLE